MERCEDQKRQMVKESKWGRKGDGGVGGGGWGRGKRKKKLLQKKKEGEAAKRKSIAVTPVSPMLVGLPVRVNKVKYPRRLKIKSQ